MSDTIARFSETDRDIAALSKTPINQLRQRWRELFRTEPPPAFGPDLLRRSIAYRIQEQQYGGLSAMPQKELDRIVKFLANRPDSRIELPRRIKPGSVLVRTWKNQSHRVTMLDEGFSFEGRHYKSLSEIAREITGTRWNGPKFFGLREERSSKSDDTSPMPPRQVSRVTILRPVPTFSPEMRHDG
jgi:hypothetical protein